MSTSFDVLADAPLARRIEDHARVMNYPMIPGVADRLYWLSHSKEETWLKLWGGCLFGIGGDGTELDLKVP